MNIHDLQTEFTRWRARPDLLVETNLLLRAEALDFFAFATDLMRLEASNAPEALLLWDDMQRLISNLTTCNQSIFAQLHSDLYHQVLRGEGLRTYLNCFTTYGTSACDGVYTSYDGLDLLLDGLFGLDQGPTPARPLEAEMVPCEEIPARVILDLIDHVAWQPHDCFYDLGSGLGQAVMLVNLLTGIDARGVEYEPAFCHYASAQAKALGLANVTFINADARVADYQDGTIFFLFTPFRGAMLNTVLQRLQRVARDHPIHICTFGPCTPQIAAEPWLQPAYGNAQHEYQLVIFTSVR
jgi:hypothetical protein